MTVILFDGFLIRTETVRPSTDPGTLLADFYPDIIGALDAALHRRRKIGAGAGSALDFGEVSGSPIPGLTSSFNIGKGVCSVISGMPGVGFASVYDKLSKFGC